MRKLSFSTVEYAEPTEDSAIIHPPVEEENFANDPEIADIVEMFELPDGVEATDVNPKVIDLEEVGGEVSSPMNGEDVLTITFEEPGDLEDMLEMGGSVELDENEDLEGAEEAMEDLEKDVDDLLGDVTENFEEEDNASDGHMIPGATEPYFEEEKVEEEPKETNWTDDRDVTHFENYLREGYGNIPSHDGRSISGCERAYAYLNRLNNEISEAVRKDTNNALDMNFIEKARVKIMKDMQALKEHMGKLKRKLKETTAEVTPIEEKLVTMGKQAREEIEKEATVARFQMVITPFERALSGILINSVISGGHPFEDVYDFLKEKYKLTTREELALLQIVMDSGFPIFKDRGTIGEAPEKGKETEKHGIDFIKNYFG